MAESPPDPRRHAVLACFCFHSFVQCFCFMDFSTDAALVQRSLAMQDGVEDGLLYYGAFAATLPAMWISMWMLLRGLDRAAGMAMSLLIVAGAWLRFAGMLFGMPALLWSFLPTGSTRDACGQFLVRPSRLLW